MVTVTRDVGEWEGLEWSPRIIKNKLYYNKYIIENLCHRANVNKKCNIKKIKTMSCKKGTNLVKRQKGRCFSTTWGLSVPATTIYYILYVSILF